MRERGRPEPVSEGLNRSKARADHNPLYEVVIVRDRDCGGRGSARARTRGVGGGKKRAGLEVEPLSQKGSWSLFWSLDLGVSCKRKRERSGRGERGESQKRNRYSHKSVVDSLLSSRMNAENAGRSRIIYHPVIITITISISRLSFDSPVSHPTFSPLPCPSTFPLDLRYVHTVGSGSGSGSGRCSPRVSCDCRCGVSSKESLTMTDANRHAAISK